MAGTQLSLKEHLSDRRISAHFSRNRHYATSKYAVEKGHALQIIDGNNKLQSCTYESVQNCIIDVGVLGVSLSPNRREAYLIPYWNSAANETICTLSISYMGMEQVAYRTGMVANIQTNIVRAGDVFKVFTKNNIRYVEHQESMDQRGQVTHAYCIATYTNGTTYVEVMDRVQIMAVRAAAAKKNNGTIPFTWVDTNPFRYEMYKKAVLRRAWKHFPKSEGPKAERIYNAVERMDQVDFEPVASSRTESVGDTSVTITDDMQNELVGMMKEAGINEKAYGRQLIGLASALGYKTPESISIDDFEKAKATLQIGLAKYVERTQGSKK